MTRPTKEHPKVSVGLPVYNGSNYLAETVDALLAQTFPDFELIIVDNASTDETSDIAQGYAETDPRVRYVRNGQNLGASPNYNKAFELARGEYFKWSAHDDHCHPDMLRRCVQALDEADASWVMAYTRGRLIDEDGQTIRQPLDTITSRSDRPHRRLATVLSGLNMCDPIFGLYRTDALRKTALIGSYCGPDYVLLGHLSEIGKILEVDEVLFGLRQHPGRSMTANRSARDRTHWYDPRAARALFVLPVWEQMVLALLRTTWNADLHWWDKVLCLWTIPRVHYARRLRVRGGAIKRRVRALLAGIARPSSSA